MRIAYSSQLRLDCLSIEQLKLNLNCRDEIIPILEALKHVFCQAESRDQLIQCVASDVNEAVIRSGPDAPLFAALAQHFTLSGVFNAALQGPARLLSAALVFHPDRKKWRRTNRGRSCLGSIWPRDHGDEPGRASDDNGPAPRQWPTNPDLAPARGVGMGW